MDGKLKIPGRLNAIAPGVLVHVVDLFSGRRFLVDTGAAFSIIPHSSSLPASGRGIVGPTGLPIKCWGEREVQLKLSGQFFKWTFLSKFLRQWVLPNIFPLGITHLFLDLMARQFLHLQPVLVLMARRFLHLQPVLVLMVRRFLHLQPVLVLMVRRSHPLLQQSPFVGRGPPMAAAWLLGFQFSFNCCCSVIRTW
jgi:hypothetical protein